MKQTAPVDEHTALLGSAAPPPYHIIDVESNRSSQGPSPSGTPIYYVCTPSGSLPNYALPRVSSSSFSSVHRLPAGPSPFNDLPLPIASALAYQQSLRHADARARGRVIRGVIGALLLWWGLSLLVGLIVENEHELEKWTEHKWRDAKRWSKNHRWGVEPELEGQEKGRWSRPLSDDPLQILASPQMTTMPTEPSEAISA
ncbi:BZ3500_MvSof-1268-A1-R1_Chr9g10703 [Microbotryum saponariae]|uniref:BZ3500_MvSof-1268-A1-R1_Chr9g10703 protein n=1 Tax=Microbotryum saponariae TaxID=289078 RepID=A0A2X0L6L6_9BASI|nr:BZ3501_MvSof-1269-A2-R1_Chr9g10451 [Microbotryum saponariae]SDA00550.1 BZ3500_MvSof-1268-A1-R1_Chr9g10703 [Microbotryum saponariae]